MNYQRNLIKNYSKYVTMKPLLTDLGISSSNYYAYMAGEDTRLSEEACEKIIQALQQRPINYQPEPYPIQINDWTEEEFNAKKEELMMSFVEKKEDCGNVVLTENMFKEIFLLYPNSFDEAYLLFDINEEEMHGKDEEFKKILWTAYSPCESNLNPESDREKDEYRGILKYLSFTLDQALIYSTAKELGYSNISISNFMLKKENEWVTIGTLRTLIDAIRRKSL